MMTIYDHNIKVGEWTVFHRFSYSIDLRNKNNETEFVIHIAPTTTGEVLMYIEEDMTPLALIQDYDDGIVLLENTVEEIDEEKAKNLIVNVLNFFEKNS